MNAVVPAALYCAYLQFLDNITSGYLGVFKCNYRDADDFGW